MVLQNCFVPDEICGNPEIYYRSSGKLCTDHDTVLLEAGEELCADTYMNMLDIGAWEKYTTIRKFIFSCRLHGKGTISLVHREKDMEKKITEVSYGDGICESGAHLEALTLQIELPEEIRSGMIFFCLKAETETQLYRANFYTEDPPDRMISLSLVICTYKRKESLEENLDHIRKDPELRKLFQEKRFIVRVVDNAKELSDSYGKGIRVYPNENTGGSGGFSRGMEESVKEKELYQTSHVILMDDDVKLQVESLHRLYALLSHIRPKYAQEPVAGRMFRLDRREIQYTAAEIWNGGDLRHIGWNQDMTLKENLPSMNNNEGAEYGGWWFACYPIEYVEKNRPLPFFLHCDDVEYGLRHGGTPIILNGIQVWHETYEYRQSPVTAYYDTRNTLIVNAMIGKLPPKDIVLGEWKRKISEAHVQGDYLLERMHILGLMDAAKGKKYLYKCQKSKKYAQLYKRRKASKIGNAILWRSARIKYFLSDILGADI